MGIHEPTPEMNGDDPDQSTTDRENALIREVKQRLGILPDLFRPAPGSSAMAGELWAFARSAWLDNALPPLFKERLFVHLSRFCTVRYSLVLHAGFLTGLGHPAGDAEIIPQTPDQLKQLLNRSLPDAPFLEAAFLSLEGLTAGSTLPDPGSQLEDDLFHALAVLFVAPTQSNRVRIAIKAAFGEAVYDRIIFLLAFIHTEHYWAETHPGLTVESDLAALAKTGNPLATLLVDPVIPYGEHARQWLYDAVADITGSPADPGRNNASTAPVRNRLAGFGEIKNAEKTLLQSEERFKVLIDSIPQIIWANDGDGNANYFNRRWYDFSGLTFEESAALGWQTIVHPDDAANSVKRWQDAMQKRKEFETEYRLRRSDGVYRWFIGRNVPLLNAEHKVLGWFGTATDIEDLKKAEALLRESEERLRITVESANDYVILTLDVEGKITSWSKGAEFAFGYTEAEVKGKYGGIIFTPADRESGAPEREIKQATIEGRAIDERWHQRKDKSRFYMSGVMAPIISDTGLQGFVKVARDLTEQKLMEQLKDEFIGIASHELKTPVTSIKGYAQILQARFADADDGEDALILLRLNAQVGRLTTLIENLLDTTKISEGKLALNPERFQLNDLIRERVEELQGLTSKHQLIFHPGDIGPVIADKERIGQVLTNLLSNAIKYSPAGGEVTIITGPAEKNVQVSVVDRGIGIPESVREKIFDRFYRVNNSSMHSFQGMGLGLYISAGIIHRHKGNIFVESTEGGGTTFRFLLPYDPLA
jgi:PAS domain S-box-containing protein